MKDVLQTIPRADLSSVLLEFYENGDSDTRAIMEDVFRVKPTGAPAVVSQWWATRPHLDGRGVVVINRAGEACGWMDALRNPEHWEPGCTAVDVEGRKWLAIGGDDYNGAREWVPVGESYAKHYLNMTRGR